MYDLKSKKAEEFISHEEILETLEYAKANKNNKELIDSIIRKAENLKGLSHREAALLLECDMEEEIQEYIPLPKKLSKILWQPYCYVRPIIPF